MSSNKVSFKVYFEGASGSEVRCFKLPHDENSFANLRIMLSSIITEISHPTLVQIAWKDKDGDLVLITSQEELNYALEDVEKGDAARLKIYASIKKGIYPPGPFGIVNYDVASVADYFAPKSTPVDSQKSQTPANDAKSACQPSTSSNAPKSIPVDSQKSKGPADDAKATCQPSTSSNVKKPEEPEKDKHGVKGEGKKGEKRHREARDFGHCKKTPKIDAARIVFNMANDAAYAPDHETYTYGPAMHPNVICDGCESQIVGYRYKCIQCSDFDLCFNCEGLAVHSDHVMMRIPYPMMLPKYMGKMMHQKRFLQSLSPLMHRTGKKHGRRCHVGPAAMKGTVVALKTVLTRLLNCGTSITQCLSESELQQNSSLFSQYIFLLHSIMLAASNLMNSCDMAIEDDSVEDTIRDIMNSEQFRSLSEQVNYLCGVIASLATTATSNVTRTPDGVSAGANTGAVSDISRCLNELTSAINPIIESAFSIAKDAAVAAAAAATSGMSGVHNVQTENATHHEEPAQAQPSPSTGSMQTSTTSNAESENSSTPSGAATSNVEDTAILNATNVPTSSNVIPSTTSDEPATPLADNQGNSPGAEGSATSESNSSTATGETTKNATAGKTSATGNTTPSGGNGNGFNSVPLDVMGTFATGVNTVLNDIFKQVPQADVTIKQLADEMKRILSVSTAASSVGNQSGASTPTGFVNLEIPTPTGETAPHSSGSSSATTSGKEGRDLYRDVREKLDKLAENVEKALEEQKNTEAMENAPSEETMVRLAHLHRMGFSDGDGNLLELLRKYKNNLNDVIEHILDKRNPK